jgi:hypothetical protein
MKKYLYSGLGLVFMAVAAFAVSGTNSQWQDSDFWVGKLKVGNGTPGLATGNEDAYVEGDLEVDGALNVAGQTVNAAPIGLEGRGVFTVCGDIATINANTIYYGPSQAVIDSATAGDLTCNTDAAGSATEATADAPAVEATAIYPLGMVCYMTDMGATGSPITFALRSAEAATTPAITFTIADNILSGLSNVAATTPIASAATVAVALTSAGDVGAGAFLCRVSYAF